MGRVSSLPLGNKKDDSSFCCYVYNLRGCSNEQVGATSFIVQHAKMKCMHKLFLVKDKNTFVVKCTPCTNIAGSKCEKDSYEYDVLLRSWIRTVPFEDQNVQKMIQSVFDDGVYKLNDIVYLAISNLRNKRRYIK